MHIVTVARMFWVFGSLFLRRCGVHRVGCCGSGIRVLSRRCDVSWVSCRGSGRLWSIYLFWTTAYFLIVRLVQYFFAVRTCYMPRPPPSDKKPHWTVQTETVRPRATQSIQTDAFILAKTHTFFRKLTQPKVHNQKAETTLRRSRGNLASCPGFRVFVWWRGLSVWSFVQSATLSFTCDTSLNRGETCLLVLAALLFCRQSVASTVPSRLRPGFLGFTLFFLGANPKTGLAQFFFWHPLWSIYFGVSSIVSSALRVGER